MEKLQINSLRVMNRDAPGQIVHTLFVKGFIPPVGATFNLFPYHDSDRPIVVKVEHQDYFASYREERGLEILLNVRCSVAAADFEQLCGAPDWVREPERS